MVLCLVGMHEQLTFRMIDVFLTTKQADLLDLVFYNYLNTLY